VRPITRLIYLLVSFLLWSLALLTILLYVSQSLERELRLSRQRPKNKGSLPLVRIAIAFLCALCLASMASDEEIRDWKVFDSVLRPVLAEGYVHRVVRADREHEVDGIAGVLSRSGSPAVAGGLVAEVGRRSQGLPDLERAFDALGLPSNASRPLR
jgi:hypothetical protein